LINQRKPSRTISDLTLISPYLCAWRRVFAPVAAVAGRTIRSSAKL
jgi:hypothetical protein